MPAVDQMCVISFKINSFCCNEVNHRLINTLIFNNESEVII